MSNFNPKKEVNKIIKFIKDYFEENNLKGVVLGISGGKDSAVVAALFAKAIGSENVLGVTMPCHSNKTDKSDALLVADKFNIQLLDVDLTDTFDVFTKSIAKLGNYSETELKNSNINIKPRLRMMCIYYLAALYSELKGGVYVVAGTSNKCELYVGYFTKGGDSTYDIGILNDYTVDEVISLGEYLDVPEKVIHKIPSDGLSNQTDEEKLGVKYSDIASVINGETIDKKIEDKIKVLHKKSMHKFYIPIFKRY